MNKGSKAASETVDGWIQKQVTEPKSPGIEMEDFFHICMLEIGPLIFRPIYPISRNDTQQRQEKVGVFYELYKDLVREDCAGWYAWLERYSYWFDKQVQPPRG